MKITEIKREFRLRLNGIKAYFATWQLWLDQKRCPHTFRPARIGNKPARVCKICEKSEILTASEFYAYFGETGAVVFGLPFVDK